MQNGAKFLRETAECFARLSHRQGVRPSVRPSHCGTVWKRCKLELWNFHYGLPSFSWQNFVPLDVGV